MAAKKQANVDLTEDIPSELQGGTESNVPAARGTTDITSAMAPGGSPHLDMTGVRPPRLQLVYGVGTLSQSFNPGDLVLDGHLVREKNKPLDVVLLNVRQFVKQRLTPAEWNEGVQPQVFVCDDPNKDAIKEGMAMAEAQGFRTRWENNAGPEVTPAADVIMLIRKPDETEDNGLFGIEFDGGSWALAITSYDKTGYNVFSNETFRVVNYKLKKTGLFSGLWELKTRSHQTKGNPTQVMGFKFKGILDPAVVQEIQEAMNVPVSVHEEDYDVPFED